jgi:hypothetical protein
MVKSSNVEVTVWENKKLVQKRVSELSTFLINTIKFNTMNMDSLLLAKKLGEYH